MNEIAFASPRAHNLTPGTNLRAETAYRTEHPQLRRELRARSDGKTRSFSGIRAFPQNDKAPSEYRAKESFDVERWPRCDIDLTREKLATLD